MGGAISTHLNIPEMGGILPRFLVDNNGSEKHPPRGIDLSGLSSDYKLALERGDVEYFKVFFDENGDPESVDARFVGCSTDIYLTDEAFDRYCMDWAKNEEEEKNSPEQRYGKKIVSISQLEKAWAKAEELGESLYIRLRDGSVLCVERAVQNYVDSVVHCIKYISADDDGVELDLNIIGDVLKNRPVIVDQTKLWDEEK